MKIEHLIVAFVLCAILALVLETTIVGFPFIVLMGLALVFWFKNTQAAIAALILGLCIDSLRVSHFGITALFIFTAMALIHLYEKYFGSRDVVVAVFVTMAAGLIYSYLANYSITLVASVFVIVIVTWYIFASFTKKQNRNYYE